MLGSPAGVPGPEQSREVKDKYFDYVDFEVQTEVMSELDLVEQIDFFCNVDQSTSNVQGVKGRLQKNIAFWKAIGAYDYVLRIIEYGYEIPFISNPPSMYFSNNKSALSNEKFVTGAISELVQSGCVIKVPFKPHVVSPLSVAENRSKQRLILDLSTLNYYVKKDKVKFEDYNTALDFFDKDCYAIKFDLKSGYHHVDISSKYQTFLGFCWQGQFYCFTVLPFGLSTAPFAFTKCLRPMVKYWRENNAKIVLYLDDGLAFASSYSDCMALSEFIQRSLKDAGFLVNYEKSIFTPVKVLEWLGIMWDSEKYTISIPDRRIEDTVNTLQRVIARFPCLTARELAQAIGKVISMSPVMGNVCCIMTRYSSMEIAKRLYWDNTLHMSDPMHVLTELYFWLRNIKSHNSKSLSKPMKKNVMIFSDASEVGAGAYSVEVNSKVFHQNWSQYESSMSSTWREMKAIELALVSFSDNLKDSCIKWFTDNQSCVKIVRSGSMKEHLHSIAFNIFSICIQNGISIEIEWIPRNRNQKADYLSKMIDHDDWGVSFDFFEFVNSLFGPFTVDRFANASNKRLLRFNSKFWNPGVEAVDCFSQNWVGENNWLVPPIHLVIKTIKHLVQCKARGSLVVPKWPSSAFWPFIFENGYNCHAYVSDVFQFDETDRIYVQGYNKKSLFGSVHFRSSVLLVNLDATRL